jgi:hypothetical protein
MQTDLSIVPEMSVMDLGTVLAKSGYFQDAKDAAQAVVKVLAGRELGFGPIASMTGFNIIKGRVSMSANLMGAAIKRSSKYNYRVRQHDSTGCSIEFFERNGDKWDSIGHSVFTIEDAHKAGTQNLEKFPRNMLFARAMSNGAKWYCPDIFGGPVYTPEELGEVVDGETGEIVHNSIPAKTAEVEHATDPAATQTVTDRAALDSQGGNGKETKVVVLDWPVSILIALGKQYQKGTPEVKKVVVQSTEINPTDDMKVLQSWYDFYRREKDTNGCNTAEAIKRADANRQSILESA